MTESMNRIFIKKIQTYALMQSVLGHDIEVLIKVFFLLFMNLSFFYRWNLQYF